MWDHRVLSRIDYRILPIVAGLMWISLLVISSMSGEAGEIDGPSFWTPLVKSQVRWFCLGWIVFTICSAFDYRKLRDWSLFLYLAAILLLIGLFFASPIQNVHRWYRIPGIASFQPSEQTKLIVVIALAWFLERSGNRVGGLTTAKTESVAAAGSHFLPEKSPLCHPLPVIPPIAIAVWAAF